MRSESFSRMAQQLVNAFATVESTEGLILFVAGTDHMLNFCQGLLEQYDRDSSAALLREVNALCQAQAVLPGILYVELRKVLLALNRFHDAGQDHFAVLGLPSHATREEVKQAYRSLSKKYHPDRLQDSGDQSQRFMEIAGAYHAIMAAAPRQQAGSQFPWRGRRPPAPGRRTLGHKVFFPGIAVMICLLAGASIYFAGRYNKQIIISQLQAGGSSSKNSVALKIPAKSSDAPPQAPTDDPPPRKGLTVDTSAPREMMTGPAPDNRQVTPDHTTLLPTAATPAPLEPAAEKNISLTGSSGTQTATHSLPEKTKVQNNPALPRQERGEQSSPPIQGQHSIPQHASPPAGQKMVSGNEKTKPQPDPLQPINSGEEILSLINHYSALYSRKELAAFLTLFSVDATENGHPLPNLTEQYRSLFAHTRAIDLHIVNTHWTKQQEGFLARGNFRSSYTYNDGRTKEHNGDISFHLIRDQGELKIKALDYVFLE